MDYIAQFEKIVKEQKERIERIKKEEDFIDFSSLDKIIIGIVPGDGIGPAITNQARRVLEHLLKGKNNIEIRTIEGCTIERRAELNQAVPKDVMDEIKKCHVLLKGPTTTPRKGDKYANVESANVFMRKELDLFANVRPVKVPELGIDWTFFRENTECLYALGSDGVQINEDLAVDFRVITVPGTRRIAKLAYDYAVRNKKRKVTIVTKANVVKTTDGKFLETCLEVGKNYKEIETDDWYIDIMTAKLIDEKRRKDFDVFVLPNLYGDILTDEAAELQGGVGTAGSANIGTKYAMFEAIHGSAPRMVLEKRDIYADPSSVIRAASMLLSHIGFVEESEKLVKALEDENKPVLTGRDTGATGEELADYIMKQL